MGDTNINQANNNNDDHEEEKEPKVNIFRKIWNYRQYLVIEPVLLCWILPSCFNIIGIQNLGLEKACRVNLNYSESVCANVLDKDVDNVDCTAYEEAGENITEALKLMLGLNYTVCVAEIETQKAVSIISGIRGPIASIFPIIVILFAGGWSDRKGVRKPCMLFPLIGETLAAVALLISSIFMEQIPMEFGNILEKVLPAMFGGQTLMIMGFYSYMTASVPEKDRVFRFGIFAMCATIIPVVGIPFSGVLYSSLGYVKLFILAICLFIVGVIYLIYFVKEVKSEPKENVENKNLEGHENLAFDAEQIADNKLQKLESLPSSPATNIRDKSRLKQHWCCGPILEFFDPELVMGCVRVLMKVRENKGRMLLWIMVLAYGSFLGPSLSEVDYIYQYVILKLSWNGDQYSYFNTYSTAIATVGTFLMTAIFSKAFSMSDSMVGLVSSLGSIGSRPVFAFALDSIAFYVAATIDMFVSVKTIAVKAIISTFVEVEELGRLYSILGIADALGGFIFPPIYSYVYLSTVETFPGAFYIFGELFFVPNAILFAITYFFLRSQKKSDNEEKPEENGHSNQTSPKEIESTYM